MKIKQDYAGNMVQLKGSSLSFFDGDTGKLFKIEDYVDNKKALQQFNRITKFKNNTQRKHHQTRVYYSQLIIQC